MEAKICGVKDELTLRYILNHLNSPRFIGFIINYKKSKRFIELKKLNKLLSINKRNSKYVAVLVKPSNNFLEKIKDLNFDYYQIYDVEPKEISNIKKKYNKKIITALTIKNENDVKKYTLYEKFSNIILFDSKGYEKSIGFDHSLIKNLKLNTKIMIAGDIKYNDELDKFNKIADIIDISGGLETLGKKDISKIDIFLKNLNKLNNEN
jgi:phosphoribosylanthranilate isomerase